LSGGNIYQYLALGDSYTIGEAVAEEERWPASLARQLAVEGVPVRATFLAQTGWTTDELEHALDHADLSGGFDLVSLLIGVNDQYRGRSLDAYRNGFTRLLARATALARDTASRVVVLSIPDWGVTPFAAVRDRDLIGRQIDRFNQVNQAVAAEQGVAYVDVTGISRQAVDRPQWLAADGLHPSGQMYERWAQLALPVARRILSPPAFT
jgi:lysophospholipase L1-like esterase